jgi:hypothetical protein
MPLRDHFRPPVDNLVQWEAVHATWPVMIVAQLRRRLPRPYIALPRTHSGPTIELEVSTFEKEGEAALSAGNGKGGVATAVWAPPRPTHTVSTDLPAQDAYEVRVFDSQRLRRLVAAIEIVSPANKHRPEHRHAFVAKCAGLLRELVSVIVIDPVTTRPVTTRSQNLYAEFLDFIGRPDPTLSAEPPSLQAVACRMREPDPTWKLETWLQPLTIGHRLPTMPLWLADNLAVPLELEKSCEQSCSLLGIR